MNSKEFPQPQLEPQRERIEKYLRFDPTNRQLLVSAIELNLALGRNEFAMAHVKSALALYPDDEQVLCLKAHTLSASLEWAAAGEIYLGLLAKLNDPKLAYSLANCQIWQGQHQNAVATLAPYENDAELPATAVTTLLRALHHVGQFDRAMNLVRLHQTRLASEPVFLAAASLLCLDMNDVAQAATFSKAALELGERPLEALVTDASLSLVASDGEQAAERFTEALAVSPEDGRLWSGLGQANMLTRDMVNATMQLEKAVKLMPNNVATWHALGWCHLLRENLVGAQHAFDTARDIDRNFAETHGALATLAAKRGDRSGAEASVELALRLDPECMSARYAQLILSGAADDPERFRALAMKVIKGRKNAFGVELTDLVKAKVDR
jgi:Flp pilus assembly protein TadD